jgi:hypothetical protein
MGVKNRGARTRLKEARKKARKAWKGKSSKIKRMEETQRQTHHKKEGRWGPSNTHPSRKRESSWR